MNSAIVRSLVRVYAHELMPAEGPISDGTVDKMAVTLSQKISAMPFLMKTALSVLTRLFDWTGLFYAGRFFCRQSFEGQRRMVHAGENSFLPPLKEILKFYQKMSVFIYYSMSQQESQCPSRN